MPVAFFDIITHFFVAGFVHEIQLENIQKPRLITFGAD
jgi:hypothetical protein